VLFLVIRPTIRSLAKAAPGKNPKAIAPTTVEISRPLRMKLTPYVVLIRQFEIRRLTRRKFYFNWRGKIYNCTMRRQNDARASVRVGFASWGNDRPVFLKMC
jgi:hypothetical protein